MAPRKELPKKKGVNPPKSTALRKNAREKVKQGPKKRESNHSYNLRNRSLVLVGVTCNCSEKDRRRLHRLHLHSNQCSSQTKKTGQCQSRVSVVTVSSEDERMSHECQNSTDVKPEPMVVDPTLSVEGMKIDTNSGSGRPSKKYSARSELGCTKSLEGMKMDTNSGSRRPSTKHSAQNELGCAMSLSGEFAGEAFRPLCFSTPEGDKHFNPRVPEDPGPARVVTGPAELNPEAVTFRLEFEDMGPPRKIPRINKPRSPITSHRFNSVSVNDVNLDFAELNPAAVSFKFNVPDVPVLRQIDDAYGGAIVESQEVATVAAAPSSEQLDTFGCNLGLADALDFAALQSSNPSQETKERLLSYSPPRNNECSTLESSHSELVKSGSEILACTCTCEKDEDSGFLFCPSGPTGELDHSGNETSYDFGLSGITLFEPAESD